MRGTRPNLATALLAVAALAEPATIAADSIPEQVLASRGLKRSGAIYVLEVESEVVPKVANLQPSYRQLKGRYDELAAVMLNQAEYDMLNDQWTLVNEQLRNVQAEQDAHPPTSNNELKQSWRNLLEAERQLRYQYNELRREVNLLYPRLVSESKREQLRNEFVKQREEFLEKSRELRAKVDKIRDDYRTLSQDDSVKQALEALKLSTKSRLSIGPSADFKKASAWLSNAVRSTAPEALTAKAVKKKVKNPATVKNVPKGKAASPMKRSSKNPTNSSRSNAPASSGPEATPK